MGAFYTNITLATASSIDAIHSLREFGRQAYVAAQASFVVVFDKESETQDTEVLGELARALSERLSCVALAVLVHDDDVLVYELHHDGAPLGDYVSNPSRLDPSLGDRPMGGDARVLCEALNAPNQTKTVQGILKPNSRAAYATETERHRALVEALMLPALAVGLGFDRIAAGDIPSSVSPDDISRV